MKWSVSIFIFNVINKDIKGVFFFLGCDLYKMSLGIGGFFICEIMLFNRFVLLVWILFI